jgi:class 3 adenylate cyclase
VDIPETRYAKTPDGLNIGYQIAGEGDRDIVFLPSVAGTIDAIWEEPSYAHVLRRLTEIGRLICVEPRNTGVSDRIPLGALPTPEEWMDDISVVMHAVASPRASLIVHGFAGALGIVFAATYPERTESLVLIESYARAAWADDYPMGLSAEMCESAVALIQDAWGTGMMVQVHAPSRIGDERFRRWFARFERCGGSPATVAAHMRWAQGIDVRSILPAIQAPTLVMHHRRSRLFHIAFSEYLAEHIPNARMRVLPGADLYMFSEVADEVIDEIEEFITGAPPVREPDRALATVLFTDIAASTEHATRLGDKKWTQLLDRHDSLIARELERHRGRRVNPTGDGILATFDGPARAVRCAQAIVEGVGPLGIDVRAGLHTGEVELRGEDIGGIAVHIGQRVSALAGPGEVLVSRTVTDLVAGSGLEFEDRGEHELKGVPGRWAIYAVTP